MKYICIGPNCWGSGPDRETAMRNCAKVGPGMRTLKKHYLLFEADDNTCVEEVFGGIETPVGGVPPKLIEKKGQ